MIGGNCWGERGARPGSGDTCRNLFGAGSNDVEEFVIGPVRRAQTADDVPGVDHGVEQMHAHRDADRKGAVRVDLDQSHLGAGVSVGERGQHPICGPVPFRGQIAADDRCAGVGRGRRVAGGDSGGRSARSCESVAPADPSQRTASTAPDRPLGQARRSRPPAQAPGGAAA